jgi:hypothetical protein
LTFRAFAQKIDPAGFESSVQRSQEFQRIGLRYVLLQVVTAVEGALECSAWFLWARLSQRNPNPFGGCCAILSGSGPFSLSSGGQKALSGIVRLQPEAYPEPLAGAVHACGEKRQRSGWLFVRRFISSCLLMRNQRGTSLKVKSPTAYQHFSSHVIR